MILYKIEYIFSNILCLCNQWANLNQIYRYCSKITYEKDFAESFLIWSILLERKACFQILNIISKLKICYIPIKSRLMLTKLSDLNVNLKRKLFLFMIFFIWNFFKQKNIFLRRNFGEIYEIVNTLHDMGNFKKVVSTKSFLFSFKFKLRTKIEMFFWRMEY